MRTILATYPEHTQELHELFEPLISLNMARHIQPPEELLKKTLRNIATPIPSMPWYYQMTWKVGVSLCAVVLIILGGAVYMGHSTIMPVSQTVSVNDPNSDAALASDATTIDTQLDDLYADNAQTDQALGN